MRSYVLLLGKTLVITGKLFKFLEKTKAML